MGWRRMQHSDSVRNKKSNRGLVEEFAEILKAGRYARFVFWLLLLPYLDRSISMSARSGVKQTDRFEDNGHVFVATFCSSGKNP